MNKAWLTWSIFALCLIVVFGAMMWFTRQIEQMQRHATIQENARLALWRLDSSLAALLTHENSLPVDGYAATPPSDAAPQIAGRFQWWPPDRMIGDAPIAQSQLPHAEPMIEPQPMQQQASKGAREFQQRAQVGRQWISNNEMLAGVTDRGAFAPAFIDEHLLLLRTTDIGDGRVVDGATVDRDALLQTVRDLLPQARLVPNGEASPYRLALAPARLIPGNVAADAAPLPPTLIVAWACVALAAVAASVLLHLTVRLSQRRAAFVSAVTHEMRTPLTTFRLYTQMLREGRVRDEAARQQYLQTLHTEADRLSHLVDNVLAHAQLERGKPPQALQPVPINALVERCAVRLRTRVEQADMTLHIIGSGDAAVRAEPSIVEQILLNLVDNACKYAASGTVTIEQRNDAIAVVDQGPGVAPDVRKRLFVPFSKSARDAAHSAPGVGLGLALSRRLARAMGGDLRYAPGDSGGAQFVLSLQKACNF